MINGLHIKHGMLSNDITYVHHHNCGVCKGELSYNVIGGELFWHDCCSGEMRPRDWSEPADWANLQSKEKNKRIICEMFGVNFNDPVEYKSD